MQLASGLVGIWFSMGDPCHATPSRVVCSPSFEDFCLYLNGVCLDMFDSLSVTCCSLFNVFGCPCAAITFGSVLGRKRRMFRIIPPATVFVFAIGASPACVHQLFPCKCKYLQMTKGRGRRRRAFIGSCFLPVQSTQRS